MQLTTHTDYALRLLIHLASKREDEPATVQDVAARYGISAHHVAKVAQTLGQLGYVHSQRGRGGGLELALAPDSIRLGEVVRQTENLKILECFGPDSTCPIEPACRLKGILDDALQSFLAVLDRYVLADLVTNRDELRGLLVRR